MDGIGLDGWLSKVVGSLRARSVLIIETLHFRQRDENAVTSVPGKVWGKDGVSAVNQENRRHWITSDQN